MSQSFGVHGSDGEAFDFFVEKAKYSRPLTVDEEIHLVRQMRRGDEEARTLILQSLFPQIVSMARHYWRPGVPFEDLVQEGALGVFKGVELFDEARGAPLYCFLRFAIRRQITEHLWTYFGVVKPSKARRIAIRQVHVREKELRLELAREPTNTEIGRSLGFSVSQVERIQAERAGLLSLDFLLERQEKGIPIEIREEVREDEPGAAIQKFHWSILMEVIKQLPELEGKVVWLLFGCDGHPPLPMNKVGDWLDLTSYRIEGIRKKALRLLGQVQASQRSGGRDGVERGRPDTRAR